MKYRAFRNHCIVRVEKGEIKSKGGIIMAIENSREDMAREEGVILNFGPDFCRDSLDDYRKFLKEGDVVSFARYGGKSLGIDKEGFEIRVMQDIDILCIRDGEE